MPSGLIIKVGPVSTANRIESVFLCYITMLSRIVADILTYHVVPYLPIPAAIAVTVHPLVPLAKVLTLAQYNQPHGMILNALTGDDTEATIYYRNGLIHREGGPAIIYPDGTTEWVQNDMLHRIGAPAVESPSGHQRWLVRGEFHCECGPAIRFVTDGWILGHSRWFVDGRECSEYDYSDALDAYYRSVGATTTTLLH